MENNSQQNESQSQSYATGRVGATPNIAGNSWYNNRYFIIFVALIIIATGIRLYYFSITANQPLWWDESSYMAVAKTYAGMGFEDLAGQRLPGYPLFISQFYNLGIHDEAAIRFIGCFLPSILMLILLYIAISLMYKDERIALISTAIMAVLWESLFYSNRFQTENLGLIFQFISIGFAFMFMKAAKTSTRTISLICCPIAALVSVLFRPAQLLFFPAVILFLIITQWNKHKGIVISSIVVMLLATAGIMMFVPSMSYLIQSYMIPDNPIAWDSMNVFSGLFTPVLDIFFFIGIIVVVLLFINYKSEEADLFNLLNIAIVLFAFMFVIRAPAFEYRWFFPLIISALVIVSKGIIFTCNGIENFIKGNTGKFVSVIFIIMILAIGLSGQLSHADSIIKQKITSYQDVKDAGIWMKENSVERDIIFSISKPQTAYYSERKVMSYSLLNNEDEFTDYIMRNNPRWLTVSVYEPHPEWIFSWIAHNNETIFPAAAYFFDEDKTKPALIIYGFNDDIRNEDCKEDVCAI